MTDKDDFVHMHLHSDGSALDGACTIKDYVAEAKKRGNPAIACSDHGTMRMSLKLHEACKEEGGIKPIFGSEFYVSPDMRRKGLTEEERAEITKGLPAGARKAAIKEYEEREGIRDRWHMCVWAKNDVGLRNLYRLSSASFIDGFYYKPRIDLKELERYKEGLIVSTGCLSSPIHDSNATGKTRQALEYADRLFDMFGEDLRLELQPHAIRDQRVANKLILELHDRFGGKASLLATQDAHYLRQSDAEHHEVLLCIGTASKLSDPDRFKFDGDEFHFRTRKEMFAAFRRHHEFIPKETVKKALDATMEMAEQMTAKIVTDYHAALLPSPHMPEKYAGDNFSYLRDLCLDGWKWRAIDRRSVGLAKRRGLEHAKLYAEYGARLRHELRAIRTQKFVPYFLIVRELYAFARGQKIQVGPGRGSAGGSLIAYLLGITAVDPIEHGLIFERFINPFRMDMPDIDMDFEDKRRHEIMSWLVQRFGQENVAQIATVGKLSGKDVLKSVARVLEVPLMEVSAVTSSIVERSSGDERASQTVEDSFKEFDVCKKFDAKYPKVLYHARHLEGLSKTLGMHAAGIVTSPVPLTDILPLEIRKHEGRNVVVTAYDMYGAAAMGLVKLDVLGLRTLTVVREAVEAVEQNRGVKIDLESEDFSLNDTKTLQAYTDHDYGGIFQYDTPGADKVCKGVTFSDFEDIAAMTALNRPGTARSGLAAKFVERKMNPKLVSKVDYHPLVSEITKDTLGIIVYQEHVIRIFTDCAGFAPGTADSLRKTMAKKVGDETMGKEREKFVKGCEEHSGIDAKTANKIMDAIVFFGCVRKGTMVSTVHGPRAIETLCAGDKIWSVDVEGKLVKNTVKAVGGSGRKPLFAVRTTQSEVLASADHWWMVRAPDGSQSFKKTSDLVPDDDIASVARGSFEAGWAPFVDARSRADAETFDLECKNEPANYLCRAPLEGECRSDVTTWNVSHNSYGFNKSHATEYGVISFWTMYLKVHYPLEFFWASLKNEPDRQRVAQLAKDAKKHGIKLLQPHVNVSKTDFAMDVPNNAIRGSLTDIKGCGDAAAETIMAQQPFTDWWDFIGRVEKRKVHKGVVLALAKAGALAGMIPNTKWFVENINEFWKAQGKKKTGPAHEMLQASRDDQDFDAEEAALVSSSVNPLAFGRHPVDAYKEFIKRAVKVPLADMSSETFFQDYNNKGTYILGIIVHVQYCLIGDFHSGLPPTEDEKRRQFWGTRFAKVNIEDKGGRQNRCIFGIDVFDRCRHIIDMGVGTPVIAHVIPNAKYENVYAQTCVELATLRNKMAEGAEKDVWEQVALGMHPAIFYKWKDEETKTKRAFNRTFKKSPLGGVFTGVVTNVKLKYDKNDNMMAFFGLLAADGMWIEAIAFSSVWDQIKGAIKPGRLVMVEIEKKPDTYRGGGWSHFAGNVRVLTKPDLETKSS